MRTAVILLLLLVLLGILLWFLVTARENRPPEVSLTAPAEGTVVESGAPLPLEAEARDADGLVASVEFWLDGVRVGSVRGRPYVFTLADLEPGGHVLSVRARDDRGAETRGGSRTFTVRERPNRLPKVTLIEPADGREVRSRRPLAVRAGASDPDGTVSEVAFLVDGEVVARAESRPFAAELGTLPEGGRSLSVRATDNRGASTETAPVRLLVRYEEVFEREIEAEAAEIEWPMLVRESPRASGGRYVMTTRRFSGSLEFGFEVPRAMEVVVWCRVISPDLSHDSFFVEIDRGASDIFDVAEGRWSPDWQWVPVNGRGGEGHALALDPRVFRISAGRHRLRFRGRETLTALDKIVITSGLGAVLKEKPAGMAEEPRPRGGAADAAAPDGQTDPAGDLF